MSAVRFLVLLLILLSPLAAPRAQAMTSDCLAMAQAPGIVPVQYTAPTLAADQVQLTFLGHSTFLIESAGGVKITTDYSGYAGGIVPDVATMNRAHRSHYTDFPDPAIKQVLRGWNPEGGPARHDLTVGDVRIRNVTTDIRAMGGAVPDGNSIFIFEVAGLCIGHLGHLHHKLDESHIAAIGRLDILMVPVDDSVTMSIDGMSEITKRLRSSIVLPMHRLGTPLQEFVRRVSGQFEVDLRPERSFSVSLETLPKAPTVVILDGV